MASICGSSSKGICLRSPFEEVVINQHFSSFNNHEHLEQKAFNHILYLFPHFLLCHLHLLLIVMLICCAPNIDLTFILNCLIFKILLKFMLKQIMLMMLQMLNLLMM